MSSREIAKLVDKRHDNVMRVIRDLISDEVLTPQVEELDFEHLGNKYKHFLLEKRDCFVVVARLSPEFTAAIVDRWQELESQSKPQVPQTYAEALQLAANQAKQLELAAPKVAFVDNLVDRTNLLTATQIGQKHKLSAIKLNKILIELNVYNGNVKRSKVFKQWFIDKGYGEMKKTELGYDQPLFTNAGEIWINEQLHSEGIV
jgi:phage regulator Rha-like protein